MRRLLALSLLLGTMASSLAALTPVPRGIFHGTWTVTNVHTDVVTSGPISAVYRETGRPRVHLWVVTETESETNYTEYFKSASRPTRRTIACTIPRFMRLHGRHSPTNEIFRRITGKLRLKEFGSGTFAVTYVNCGINELNSGIPLQLVLRDIYQIPCSLTPPPPIRATNFPDRLNPPTNLPPILPPTRLTNDYDVIQHVEVRRSNVLSNITQPLNVIVGTNLPTTDANVVMVGVTWTQNAVLAPQDFPVYTNIILTLPPQNDYDGAVIRAWLNSGPLLLPGADNFAPRLP
jgi:hypothetical protein